MGQRRALGLTGGAAGELDVDRIIVVERRLDQGQTIGVGLRMQIGPVQPVLLPFVTQHDHLAQRREPIRPDVPQHRHIVATPESGRGDQQAAPDLV